MKKEKNIKNDWDSAVLSFCFYVFKGLSFGSKSWAQPQGQWTGPEILMPEHSGDASARIGHIQGYSWSTPLIFPGTRRKLSASLRVTLRLDSIADLPNDHGMGTETEVNINGFVAFFVFVATYFFCLR